MNSTMYGDIYGFHVLFLQGIKGDRGAKGSSGTKGDRVRFGLKFGFVLSRVNCYNFMF